MAKIELSTEVKGRQLKMLFFGTYGSWKTETGLRNFPHVFLIDCEGNSDHCIGMPEIKPFLRLVTKDLYEILDTIDDITSGKVKFPDGSLVETLMIDGASVLWSVRQEAGALFAEKRMSKHAGGHELNPDDVGMTPLDWVQAKRPMKRLYARINASGIPFVILTAREKDLFAKGGNLEVIGQGADAMKGLEYDVNLVLQFFSAPAGQVKVLKTQGTLSKILKEGSVLKKFPASELIAYAKAKAPEERQDETEIAKAQFKREDGKSQKDLLTLAKTFELNAAQVSELLKKAGIEQFDPENWDAMVKAITP